METLTTRDITHTGIMAALVFVGVSIIKIPAPNGYTHIGDCIIFVGVILLGGKKGGLAGGIGAAFADLLGGYVQWIFPTFFIKLLMGMTMGFVIEKWMPHGKYNWLVGGIAGGIVQIAGYTLTDILYYGFAAAIVGISGIIIQTIFAILITSIIISVLETNCLLQKAKRTIERN